MMSEFLTPTYRLEQEQFIPRPRSEVFRFFSNAFNLELLTPSFVKLKILTPAPFEMHPGALIDYRLSVFGLGMNWRARIESQTPEESFVDTQERGPYASWHHTHTFHEVEGGTLIRDVVQYQMPFGLLGRLAHGLFVQRWLRHIFTFRRQALLSVFDAS